MTNALVNQITYVKKSLEVVSILVVLTSYRIIYSNLIAFSSEYMQPKYLNKITLIVIENIDYWDDSISAQSKTSENIYTQIVYTFRNTFAKIAYIAMNI